MKREYYRVFGGKLVPYTAYIWQREYWSRLFGHNYNLVTNYRKYLDEKLGEGDG